MAKLGKRAKAMLDGLDLNASYSIDEGWNWHCWKCVPDNKNYERTNYAQTSD